MTNKEFADRLAKRTKRVGLTIAPQLAEALETYYRLLEFWNQKINLTAFSLVDAPDEAIDRLLVEPLVASRLFHGAHGHGHIHEQLSAHPRVLDIGSGGGSPAIPLKLATPSLHLMMVESKTRKSAFLREAIRVLNLENTSVETARAEDLITRSELHESQEILTIRAVRLEQKLLMRLQAFLRLGGRIMLFRSNVTNDAPPLVSPPLAYEATYPLVESMGSRLVILRKML